MSLNIGSVNGPEHSSSDVAFDVWCSVGGVEVHVHAAYSFIARPLRICRNLDPVGARNLAALLVRAAEEAEMMAFRKRVAEADSKTPLRPGEKA